MTLLEFLQCILTAIGIGAIGLAPFVIFVIFMMRWCDYYAWQKQASVPRPVLCTTENTGDNQ